MADGHDRGVRVGALIAARRVAVDVARRIDALTVEVGQADLRAEDAGPSEIAAHALEGDAYGLGLRGVGGRGGVGEHDPAAEEVAVGETGRSRDGRVDGGGAARGNRDGLAVGGNRRR